MISFFVMVGHIIAPIYFDNKYKYWSLLVSIISMIFHLFYLYPTITSIDTYWILHITMGLSLGLVSMISEMIQIEIQPKEDSGKINGAKGLI